MIINPIHVREGEAVDIHWHTKTDVFIERRTCPPRPLLEKTEPTPKKAD